MIATIFISSFFIDSDGISRYFELYKQIAILITDRVIANFRI